MTDIEKALQAASEIRDTIAQNPEMFRDTITDGINTKMAKFEPNSNLGDPPKSLTFDNPKLQQDYEFRKYVNTINEKMANRYSKQLEWKAENQSLLGKLGANAVGFFYKTIGSAVNSVTFGLTNKLMGELVDKQKELYPVYHTQEYLNKPWWQRAYQDFGEWAGESLLENSGFMAGMVLSGRAFGLLGDAANKVMMGRNMAKLAATVPEAERTLGTLLQSGNANAAAQLVNSLQKKQKALAFGTQLVGQVAAAIGEATTEGDEVYKNVLRDTKRELADYRKQNFDGLYFEYANSEEAKKGMTFDEYLRGKFNNIDQNLESIAQKAKNTTIGFNMPILLLENALVWKRYFKPSFATTASQFDNLLKNVAMETKTQGKMAASKYIKKGITEVPIRLTKAFSKAMKIYNYGKAPVFEGGQEMLQAMTSSGAEYWAGSKVNDMLGFTLNQKYNDKAVGLLKSASAGFGDSFLNPERWEEGFVGGLMGIFGMPNITYSGYEKTNTKKLPSTEQMKQEILDENPTSKDERVVKVIEQIRNNPEQLNAYSDEDIKNLYVRAYRTKRKLLPVSVEWKNSFHIAHEEMKEREKLVGDFVDKINNYLQSPEEHKKFEHLIKQIAIEDVSLKDMIVGDKKGYKDWDFLSTLELMSNLHDAGLLKSEMTQLYESAKKTSKDEFKQLMFEQTGVDMDATMSEEDIEAAYQQFKKNVDTFKEDIDNTIEIKKEIDKFLGNSMSNEGLNYAAMHLGVGRNSYKRAMQLIEKNQEVLQSLLSKRKTQLRKDGEEDKLNYYNSLDLTKLNDAMEFIIREFGRVENTNEWTDPTDVSGKMSKKNSKEKEEVSLSKYVYENMDAITGVLRDLRTGKDKTKDVSMTDVIEAYRDVIDIFRLGVDNKRSVDTFKHIVSNPIKWDAQIKNYLYDAMKKAGKVNIPDAIKDIEDLDMLVRMTKNDPSLQIQALSEVQKKNPELVDAWKKLVNGRRRLSNKLSKLYNIILNNNFTNTEDFKKLSPDEQERQRALLDKAKQDIVEAIDSISENALAENSFADFYDQLEKAMNNFVKIANIDQFENIQKAWEECTKLLNESITQANDLFTSPQWQIQEQAEQKEEELKDNYNENKDVIKDALNYINGSVIDDCRCSIKTVDGNLLFLITSKKKDSEITIGLNLTLGTTKLIFISGSNNVTIPFNFADMFNITDQDKFLNDLTAALVSDPTGMEMLRNSTNLQDLFSSVTKHCIENSGIFNAYLNSITDEKKREAVKKYLNDLAVSCGINKLYIEPESKQHTTVEPAKPETEIPAADVQQEKQPVIVEQEPEPTPAQTETPEPEQPTPPPTYEKKQSSGGTYNNTWLTEYDIPKKEDSDKSIHTKHTDRSDESSKLNKRLDRDEALRDYAKANGMYDFINSGGLFTHGIFNYSRKNLKPIYFKHIKELEDKPIFKNANEEVIGIYADITVNGETKPQLIGFVKPRSLEKSEQSLYYFLDQFGQDSEGRYNYETTVSDYNPFYASVAYHYTKDSDTPTPHPLFNIIDNKDDYSQLALFYITLSGRVVHSNGGLPVASWSRIESQLTMDSLVGSLDKSDLVPGRVYVVVQHGDNASSNKGKASFTKSGLSFMSVSDFLNQNTINGKALQGLNDSGNKVLNETQAFLKSLAAINKDTTAKELNDLSAKINGAFYFSPGFGEEDIEGSPAILSDMEDMLDETEPNNQSDIFNDTFQKIVLNKDKSTGEIRLEAVLYNPRKKESFIYEKNGKPMSVVLVDANGNKSDDNTVNDFFEELNVIFSITGAMINGGTNSLGLSIMNLVNAKIVNTTLESLNTFNAKFEFKATNETKINTNAKQADSVQAEKVGKANEAETPSPKKETPISNNPTKEPESPTRPPMSRQSYFDSLSAKIQASKASTETQEENPENTEPEPAQEPEPQSQPETTEPAPTIEDVNAEAEQQSKDEALKQMTGLINSLGINPEKVALNRQQKDMSIEDLLNNSGTVANFMKRLKDNHPKEESKILEARKDLKKYFNQYKNPGSKQEQDQSKACAD